MELEQLASTVLDGKYRLDRQIGEGAMGAVYLATQLMVDRPVAIKLLHSGLNGHEKLKQRFEREAKAIGRLNHPNCITLFDFGFSHELEAFYTVMEFLEGTPMHERVVKGVSVQDALVLTRQVATALDHAHHKGILHRDLKPENIMLAKMTDGSELVKVLDFGIARIFQDTEEETEANRLTKAGEVFGTPAYISPEQARGERNLTPASDLYSLGVMLFEMIDGRLPFWGDSAIDTIMQHITSPIPTLFRPDAPEELKQLVYRLLAKDPSERLQSGKELSDELTRIERLMIQMGAAQMASVAAAYEPSFTGEMQRPVFAQTGANVHGDDGMATDMDAMSTFAEHSNNGMSFPTEPNPATGAFGATPAAASGSFGATPAATSGAFGATPAAATGSFGATPAPGAFSATPAAGYPPHTPPAGQPQVPSMHGMAPQGYAQGVVPGATMPPAGGMHDARAQKLEEAERRNKMILGGAIVIMFIAVIGLGAVFSSRNQNKTQNQQPGENPVNTTVTKNSGTQATSPPAHTTGAAKRATDAAPNNAGAGSTTGASATNTPAATNNTPPANTAAVKTAPKTTRKARRVTRPRKTTTKTAPQTTPKRPETLNLGEL